MAQAAVSIVIPAYNEEDGIVSVLDALRSLPLEKEIIVVDDGSTDRTSDMARAAGAKVVRRAGNIGYGRSIKDGVEVAAHDIIVITDADGTYPVESIPELVAKMQEGFDMAVGARQGKEYRGSLLKWPARLFLKFIVEFTTGRRIPDINSGLRAFRKHEAMKYWPALCDTFSFTTTITLTYLLTRHTVAYLPIAYHKRVGRSHVRIVKDSLRTMQYIMECIARFNPIKLFLLLAMLAVTLGIASFPWLYELGIALGMCTAIVVFAIGILSVSLRD